MTAPGNPMVPAFPAPDLLVDLLFEQLDCGVLVIDAAGSVVRTTSRLREMVAGAADLNPGAPAMSIFAAEARDALWRYLRASLMGGQQSAELVALQTAAGADPCVVELTAVTLPDGPGALGRLLLRLVDVSARERLAMQQIQSQRLSLLGRLTASIAHDFNNLLTVTIGATEMIEARLNVDADTRDDVAAIRGSADRGTALVRRLLAFARQERPQACEISVDYALRDLSALLVRLLSGRITFDVDLRAPGVKVLADPVQLDQVLINLVVNAREAMPEGGTSLLKSAALHLQDPCYGSPDDVPPGAYALIEVQDAGTGIHPSLLPRIFDPFFTTIAARGGSGLGLSTVRNIIRSSGGYLRVESVLGRGTCMRVYLPRSGLPLSGLPLSGLPLSGVSPPGRYPLHSAATSPATPDSSTRPGEATAGTSPIAATFGHAAGPTLLLVDDDAAVRQLAERALLLAGWTVLTADSGQAALDLLEAQPIPVIDLVISDVMMPGLDGLCLVERLRDRWPGLPALLISGYADAKLRERLGSLQAAFLLKPYRLRELTAAAAASR